MSDRIRTVDMSDPAVVLDCYRKLNVAYKELKAENEKLLAAIRENDQNFMRVDKENAKLRAKLHAATGELCDRAAAAALKETGDE